jgi:signal transduction histidine kinase
MNIINLFSKTYELQIEAKGRVMLDLIEKSAKRLSLMIDGLLQFSKIDGISLLKKSKVTLSETITELTELIGNENNLKISLHSDFTTIETYPVMLDQILINLFTNSLKYSHTKISEIELYVSDNPSHYLFIVKDNGPGIDKKYQGAIFNLFQTATNKDQFGNKGNGIGLAIVKKIIEKLGGKIYVESELGHGAEFHFSISK